MSATTEQKLCGLFDTIRSLKKNIIEMKDKYDKLEQKVTNLLEYIEEDKISYESDDSFYNDELCKKYLDKRDLSKDVNKFFDIDKGCYVERNTGQNN